MGTVSSLDPRRILHPRSWFLMPLHPILVPPLPTGLLCTEGSPAVAKPCCHGYPRLTFPSLFHFLLPGGSGEDVRAWDPHLVTAAQRWGISQPGGAQSQAPQTGGKRGYSSSAYDQTGTDWEGGCLPLQWGHGLCLAALQCI